MKAIGALLVTIAALGLGGAGMQAATAASGDCTGASTITCTFTYTGSPQVFTVPAGVDSLHVVAVGGMGGGSYQVLVAGGYGAVVEGDLAVTPAQELQIRVGDNGASGGSAAGAGGFNGGGSGGPSYQNFGGGGGGGASDIRIGGTTLADRVVVAAGGGGAGGGGEIATGAGGDAGSPGSASGSAGGGAAGTASAGGAGGSSPESSSFDGEAGAAGLGGAGGYRYGGPFMVQHGGGGGGGGGYYGGGGGAGRNSYPSGGGGGGGGSSYVGDLTGSSVATDMSGTPSITIEYSAVDGVSYVTSSAEDGTYHAGDVIPIELVFTEAVTVTGTPQLTLETGATDRVVDYSGGSGTDTLTFDYTVQTPDTSDDLDYASSTALALDGGTIRDALDNDVALILPAPGSAGSLAANKAIVVDTGCTGTTSVTCVFPQTGSEQTFTVPAHASSIHVVAVGAAGGGGAYGGGGGRGAIVAGDLAVAAGTDVAPGTLLYVEVGGAGTVGQANSLVAPGGFNGGGDGGYALFAGGGGGGATDLRTVSNVNAGTTLGSRLLVAAGGGGGGAGTASASGGNAGGSGGGGSAGGGAGSALGGGAAGAAEPGGSAGSPGVAGSGGAGGGGSSAGGGGGGGLYGGGGGGGGGYYDDNYFAGGGGGGGSSSTGGLSNASVAVNWASAAPSVTISYWVGAVVTNVTSPSANGAYGAGEELPIEVVFDQAVNVTGTPQLTLETGATDRAVDYASGSGTSTLTFVYAVQAGDTSADLDYVSTSALALNGGTIKDAASNDANLTLPEPGASGSLGFNKELAIETGPKVLEVTSTTPSGAYMAGQSISIQVAFDQTVVVTGAPTLTLETGTTDAVAGYSAGSGSATLTFAYTVQAGDNSADLDYVSTTALALNGGTIQSALGSGASLTLPAPGGTGSLGFNASIVIDTTAPTVTLTEVNGSEVDFPYATQSEIASVGGACESGDGAVSVTLDGEPADGSAECADGAWTLTLDPAVSSEGAHVFVASQTDTAGNTGGSGSTTVTIDRTAPAVAFTHVNGTAVSFPYRTKNDISSVGGTCTEGDGAVSVQLGGSPTEPATAACSEGTWTLSLSTAVSEEGAYWFAAYQIDAAGNLGASGNTSVTVDRIAPRVTLAKVNGSTVAFPYTTGSDVTSVGGECSLGDGSVSVTLDGDATSPATAACPEDGLWTLTLTTALSTEGAHSFAASQTDAAGNTGGSGSKTVTIDRTGPAVTDVTSSTADGAYKAGATISIQVVFDAVVHVTGAPHLVLETGATDRSAGFTGGSSSTTLSFSYTVVAGDESGDLDYASSGALTLEGATIRDGVGNDASLTLPPPGEAGSLAANKAIVIDTTAPTVTLTKVNGATVSFPYATGNDVASVGGACTTGGGPVSVTLDGEAAVPATAECSAGAWTLTLTTPLSAAGAHSFAASQTDAAGNTGGSGSIAVTIDRTGPSVTNVTSSTANGIYKAGAVVSIQVVFGEAVTVTGTPQLTLETGATDRSVDYTSGSGTSTLTFAYTVQAGDTSDHLDYASSEALTLAGGTIEDGQGNDASLTLPAPGQPGSLAANKAIVVDTTAPTVVLTQVNGATIEFPYATADDIGSVGGTCTTGDGSVSVTLDGEPAVPATAPCSVGVWTRTLTTALSEDGAHTFAASQTDAAGNTGSSDEQTVTIDKTGPDAPALTAPTGTIGDPTPTISWTDESASGATGYHLQVAVKAATCDFTGTLTIDETLTTVSYTPTDDLADGSYCARVNASDAAANTSGWSTVAEFTLDTTGPATPNLTAPTGVIGDSTPTITWTNEAASGAAGYDLQVAAKSGATCDFAGDLVIDQAGLNDLAYTSAALADGSYCARVRANDSLGNHSAWSTAGEFTVDTAAPAAPTLTAPTGTVNDLRPAVSWTDEAASGATGYHLQVAVKGATCDFTGTPAIDVTVATTGYTPDADLGYGAYCARVSASDAAANTSGWSSVAEFTIAAAGPSSAGISLGYHAGTLVDATGAELWTNAAQAHEADVAVGTATDFVVEVTLTVTGTVTDVKVDGTLTARGSRQPTFAWVHDDTGGTDEAISKGGKVSSTVATLGPGTYQLHVSIASALWTKAAGSGTQLTGGWSVSYRDSANVKHKAKASEAPLTVNVVP